MTIYLGENSLGSDHVHNICEIFKNNQSIKKINLGKYFC